MLSIWESGSFHRKPQVVVVGGGIVGLFTALFYKRAEPRHHVVVLEKGQFPSGASVKNAGFACFGSPSELLADIDLEGADAALGRVEMRWKGLQDLRYELGDGNIGFEQCGGHEIFTTNDPLYTKVQERFDELNNSLRPIFGTQAYRWDDGLIPKFGLGNTTHLAHTSLEGALNSGAMMETLLHKAVSEGIVFRPNAHVRSLNETGSNVELHLSGGDKMTADKVVIATNGYTTELLPDLDVSPGRGQVILTEPIPGLRLEGTFHLNEGFYYFRHLNGCVLFGGGRELDLEGETTVEEGPNPIIIKALERILHEIILPDQEFTIARRWSGIMAFGKKSKAPLVEYYSERIITAVRLGGMGVAIGIHVARQAAGLLNDKHMS